MSIKFAVGAGTVVVVGIVVTAAGVVKAVDAVVSVVTTIDIVIVNAVTAVSPSRRGRGCHPPPLGGQQARNFQAIRVVFKQPREYI